MDIKVRKLITYHRMYHPRAADTECLYVKRENDRKVLIQLELTYKTITMGLLKYLKYKIDWMLQLVKTHEKLKKNI